MRHLKVGGLMTDDVVTALPNTSFRDVANLLAEHDISGLPVVDADDHVVGVVSESDLLARRALSARPDPEIRWRVREEVLSDAMDLPQDAVDVHVLDGVVTLAGRLRRRSQAAMPLRLAEHVDGVVAVVDRLSAPDDGARLAPASTRTAHDFSE